MESPSCPIPGCRIYCGDRIGYWAEYQNYEGSGLRMGLLRRTFLILAVTALVPGCSSYKVATLPGDTGLEERQNPDIPVLEKHSKVRVELKTGDRLTGEVLHIADDTITLGKFGNYGFEKSVIQISDIEKIETEAATKTGSAVVTIFIVGAVVVAGVFALFAMDL